MPHSALACGRPHGSSRRTQQPTGTCHVEGCAVLEAVFVDGAGPRGGPSPPGLTGTMSTHCLQLGIHHCLCLMPCALSRTHVTDATANCQTANNCGRRCGASGAQGVGWAAVDLRGVWALEEAVCAGQDATTTWGAAVCAANALGSVLLHALGDGFKVAHRRVLACLIDLAPTACLLSSGVSKEGVQ
jgi:hypothetical protein